MSPLSTPPNKHHLLTISRRVLNLRILLWDKGNMSLLYIHHLWLWLDLGDCRYLWHFTQTPSLGLVLLLLYNMFTTLINFGWMIYIIGLKRNSRDCAIQTCIEHCWYNFSDPFSIGDTTSVLEGTSPRLLLLVLSYYCYIRQCLLLLLTWAELFILLG